MNNRHSWLAVLFLLLGSFMLPGCDRDAAAPLGPEASSEASRPAVDQVTTGSDALADQTMAFALGIIDDLMSGDPARADQALAVIESLDPGFYQRMIDGLAAAAGSDAGAVVVELDLPETMSRQGGGSHKIKITVEGQLTVKKDSWFSVAGAKTEFLDQPAREAQEIRVRLQ